MESNQQSQQDDHEKHFDKHGYSCDSNSQKIHSEVWVIKKCDPATHKGKDHYYQNIITQKTQFEEPQQEQLEHSEILSDEEEQNHENEQKQGESDQKPDETSQKQSEEQKDKNNQQSKKSAKKPLPHQAGYKRSLVSRQQAMEKKMKSKLQLMYTNMEKPKHNESKEFSMENIPGYKNWHKVSSDEGAPEKYYYYNDQTKETSWLHPADIVHGEQGETTNLILSHQGEQEVLRLRQFLDELEIELVLNQVNGKIDYYCGDICGQAVTEKLLLKYIPIFIEQFKIYDKSVILKSKTEKIIFASKLTFSGQKRAAIPTFNVKKLFFDIDYATQYGKHVIHHEYYHQMDYGIWGNKVNNGPDKEWNTCNPDGFCYGQNLQQQKPQGNMTGGALMRDAKTAYSAVEGFCNNYAATAQEEDKAEVWAHMILKDNFYGDCPYLTKKHEYMKKLMQKNYTYFDESFWNDKVPQLKPTKK